MNISRKSATAKNTTEKRQPWFPVKGLDGQLEEARGIHRNCGLLVSVVAIVQIVITLYFFVEMWGVL